MVTVATGRRRGAQKQVLRIPGMPSSAPATAPADFAPTATLSALSFSALVVAPIRSLAASRMPPTAFTNFVSWTSFAPGIAMLTVLLMTSPSACGPPDGPSLAAMHRSRRRAPRARRSRRAARHTAPPRRVPSWRAPARAASRVRQPARARREIRRDAPPHHPRRRSRLPRDPLTVTHGEPRSHRGRRVGRSHSPDPASDGASG